MNNFKLGKDSEINCNFAEIDDTVVIGENVQIDCNSIKLGKFSTIGDNVKITCNKFETGDWLYMCNDVEIGRGGCTGPDSAVKIGSGVGIFENTVINPSEPVEIGDNCGIGADVMIWTHGAWLDIAKGFPSDFGPVKIGKDVWLPARSIVLPNVEIGDSVVIGINSIINRSLPDGCFAAGSPCKVIKEDVYPKKLSDEQIKEMVENIISDWLILIKEKGVTRTVEISYKNNEIVLNQGYEQTIYNVVDKKVNGAVNMVSEDLQDYLRRRGIKIYADRFFKSI